MSNIVIRSANDIQQWRDDFELRGPLEIQPVKALIVSANLKKCETECPGFLNRLGNFLRELACLAADRTLVSEIYWIPTGPHVDFTQPCISAIMDLIHGVHPSICYKRATTLVICEYYWSKFFSSVILSNLNLLVSLQICVTQNRASMPKVQDKLFSVVRQFDKDKFLNLNAVHMTIRTKDPDHYNTKESMQYKDENNCNVFLIGCGMAGPLVSRYYHAKKPDYVHYPYGAFFFELPADIDALMNRNQTCVQFYNFAYRYLETVLQFYGINKTIVERIRDKLYLSNWVATAEQSIRLPHRANLEFDARLMILLKAHNKAAMTILLQKKKRDDVTNQISRLDKLEERLELNPKPSKKKRRIIETEEQKQKRKTEIHEKQIKLYQKQAIADQKWEIATCQRDSAYFLLRKHWKTLPPF
jgi:hypothetical protein